MPDFIRAAIEAQGKLDPDEVEAQADALDLDALHAPVPVERRLPYKDDIDIPEPEQQTIDHHLHARTSDPEESHLAGAAVEQREGSTAAFTPGSHKHRILAEYDRADGALTDTQAWTRAGIGARSGAWHRCSDLLDAGAIEKVGTVTDAETGQEVRVCRVTAFGREVLAVLDTGKRVRPR